MKKLSILIALILGITVFSTACSKVENSSSGGTSSSQSTSDKDSSGSETDSASSGAESTSGDTSSSAAATQTEVKIADVATDIQKVSTARYGYNTLSAEEKVIYDKIVKAASSYQSTVDFGKEISAATYQKVFTMAYFQETGLFWFRGLLDHFSGDTSQTASLYYRTDEASAVKMQGEIDAVVKKIFASFPSGATDVDKLKVIHDYIAKNCAFTKDGDFPQTIYGALVQGKVQCEGYAKAMGYLCDKAGIENLLIVGTIINNGSELSHAWNMVKIDNEWYNIDATWDDPTGHEDNPNYVRYTYFNVPDAEILNKSHFQDLDLTAFTPPSAKATKANYQIYYKLYATTYDEAVKLLNQELTKASSEKREEIQIKVSSKEVLNELYSKLADKSGIFTMLKDANKSAKNKFKTDTVTPAKDENTLTLQFVVKYQ